MPRKLLTIFCMLLMLLFHYGRMVSYWGCEMIFSANPSNATCDCEKQSKEATTDAQQSSSQKASKEKSEDLLANNRYLSIAALYPFKARSISEGNDCNLLAGIDKSIFQPP